MQNVEPFLFCFEGEVKHRLAMSRGPLRIWVVLVVVCAKLCCASKLTWPLGTVPEDKWRLLNYNYPTVPLSTVGLSPRSYRNFIADLRDRLRGPEDRYEIPLLRSRANVEMSQRFVLVELSNYGEMTVTLALDVINAYVVGYRAGGYSIFLRPDNTDAEDANLNLFQGTQRSTLGFTGSYGDLQRVAERNRENLDLGPSALDQSISAMYRFANPRPGDDEDQDAGRLARAFLVVIQMVSEAARFRFIERLMANRIRLNEDSAPHASITELENSWGALSRAIQESNQGMFARTIRLRDLNDSIVEVDNAAQMTSLISLMLFVCNPPSSSQLSGPDHLLLLKHSGPDTCPPIPEPTRQIVGPGGLCVDVRNGDYSNGNPIQLWPCRSSNNENQLWMFKRDGTIRSKGKCMAANYGTPTGNYIMIYDCRPAIDVFTWRVWVNGTILSGAVAGGLVLAAGSSASGTTLSIQENRYTPGQSWRPTSTAAALPAAGPIVGILGLCLQANGAGNVQLRGCIDAAADQSWALYPDGSIRPQQRRSSCLAPPRVDLPLRVVNCDPNSSLQRWLFANDGTIVNPLSQLVMDAKGSASTGFQIILNGFSGEASQLWQPFII